MKMEAIGLTGRWLFLVVKPAVNTLATAFD
jgi:hypothetical protein